MNNLYRELAPITGPAWAEIEEEARRTFKRNIAGRRIVDVEGPSGFETSSVTTGHIKDVQSYSSGLHIRQRIVQEFVELRAPFTITREAIDDVARGSGDSDWQPVKDAATTIALAEDRAILHGLDSAGIGGIVPNSSNAAVTLPDAVEDYADAVAQALSGLRTAGVDGPYSLLLSEAEYTKVSESTDHGFPIRDHLSRQLGAGEIVWAPALEGALLVSTRGGDYELHLGQDLSIGYSGHDSETVDLYLQETFGFLALTDESSVPLHP
ncbi:family 1 encapsulin nanocompartment shell protein [Brevibacterium sp. H602]|uniref:family 1 encapsulin nanocompartment shell protein n=1 Tax=unclassified Brevibacterium TaxID=2614124 RepID=UPI0039791EF4